MLSKHSKIRLIRDTRDATRDQYLDKDEAYRRYKCGEIALDCNNSKPGEPVYITR